MRGIKDSSIQSNEQSERSPQRMVTMGILRGVRQSIRNKEYYKYGKMGFTKEIKRDKKRKNNAGLASK